MPDYGGNDPIVSHLLAQMVVQRVSPNRAVSDLVSADPDAPANDLQLTLLETALHLEDMYDELRHNEWNEWQRVDYWSGISLHNREQHGGSAGLLELKSELYRAISLMTCDVIQLQTQGIARVTGKDLLRVWQERPSEYF